MRVAANGIGIEVADDGPVGGEPLLLIMGLGMQLIAWPDEFVELLVRDGFRVIRFDNRDAGLSEGFDAHGMPNLLWAALRYRLGLPIRDTPYTVDDMALDALGVLDALGISSAHLCGASMGGMVAQTLAAMHPQRVQSLALMMTSSGARNLPHASRRVQRALLSRPDARDTDAVVRHLEQLFRLIGSTAYPSDPAALRSRIERTVARAYRPAGAARQLMAIAAHGDRTPLLHRIVAPTVVIHGRDDPLVPPAAAYDLQRKIAGAELEMIDGMGHDLPAALLPRHARSLRRQAERGARVAT